MSAGAPPPPAPVTRHATSVAIDGRALLITGASGSGKSALALDLIGRGALLISDDLTRIEPGDEGWPVATGTGRMTGVIEARGMGLLAVPHTPRAPVAAVVTLDEVETARLPAPRSTDLLGVAVPLVARVDSPSFPAFLIALVKGGRVA